MVKFCGVRVCGVLLMKGKLIMSLVATKTSVVVHVTFEDGLA